MGNKGKGFIYRVREKKIQEFRQREADKASNKMFPICDKHVRTHENGWVEGGEKVSENCLNWQKEAKS